jgi:hypothetical protein
MAVYFQSGPEFEGILAILTAIGTLIRMGNGNPRMEGGGGMATFRYNEKNRKMFPGIHDGHLRVVSSR